MYFISSALVYHWVTLCFSNSVNNADLKSNKIENKKWY